MRESVIKKVFLFVFLFFLAGIIGCISGGGDGGGGNGCSSTYNPVIDPADFVKVINNPYLTLTPGTTFIYEGESEDGTERIEVFVTDRTKKILGVTCIVVRDRVWLEGELVEDTRDWHAQDKEGNVWYFGEDSREIEDGEVVSTEGSWKAGVDCAQPGIIMPANPQPGYAYREEYYEGEAEDMAMIMSLDGAVTVAFGSYNNCLQTANWTPLEPDVVEYKYYCPDVGGVVFEEMVQGGEEQVELIDITTK